MEANTFSLSEEEAFLLERAGYIYRQKNGAEPLPGEVVLECIRTYVELYDRRFGLQDALSQRVVRGDRYRAPPVTDLDEIARLLVKGSKCVNCGKCCQKVLGVRVTEKEVEEIEKLGYRREDFLDEDGMIKRGRNGCYFLIMRRDGTSRCRIYEKRPQICRDYFCNGKSR